MQDDKKKVYLIPLRLVKLLFSVYSVYFILRRKTKYLKINKNSVSFFMFNI